MRHWGMVMGGLLLLASSAGAQVNTGNSLLLTAPSFSDAPNAPSATDPAAAPTPSPATSWGRSDQGPGVHGVYGDTYTQVSVGYTYMRFYQLPGTEQNLNGVNGSAQYYFKDWIGADAEVFAAFGSLGGQSSNFVFGGAGARVRHVMRNGLEIWAHALGGYAHNSPATIFARQDAPGFLAGGGMDFGRPHRRWGYRLQADLVGSYLFGSYQYSPKVSAGLVFKF